MARQVSGRVRPLFSPWIRSKQACQRFLRPGKRIRSELVRLPHAVHTAVFSPTGGGKGVSMILPFLMDCPDSAVVVDVKGENARLTARLRQKNVIGSRKVQRPAPVKCSAGWLRGVWIGPPRMARMAC